MALVLSIWAKVIKARRNAKRENEVNDEYFVDEATGTEDKDLEDQ